jgi:hypothetical protein
VRTSLPAPISTPCSSPSTSSRCITCGVCTWVGWGWVGLGQAGFESPPPPTHTPVPTTLRTPSLPLSLVAGTLPPALSSLTNLSYLQLATNKLTGSLPGALASVPALATLMISGNSFLGSLGSEIGALSRLRDLQVTSMLLNGTLPTTLGNLTGLTYEGRCTLGAGCGGWGVGGRALLPRVRKGGEPREVAGCVLGGGGLW